MREEYLYTINKHGKKIAMPPSSKTKQERKVMKILDEFGVNYVSQFKFDETGYRSYPFDIAVFDNDGNLAFLIECDGESHYSPEYFKAMGNREERNLMHVIKNQFAVVRKAQIVVEKNVPLLRIDALYENCIRYILMVWVWSLVDKCEEKNREISSVMMFDKYGWDFDYVPQFSPSEKVENFLIERQKNIGLLSLFEEEKKIIK